MPLFISDDDRGAFIQYGTHGHKYYFNKNNVRSYNTAYDKALAQMRAIFRTGYKESKK
jgi:hypothetical protein